jgi:hypothetical protein
MQHYPVNDPLSIFKAPQLGNAPLWTFDIPYWTLDILRSFLVLGSVLYFTSFTPPQPGPCVPHSQVFHGYTFFDADFVNASAAYAPFFLRFGDYYERNFIPEEVQKKENCEEWSERFCSKSKWEDVAAVIYESDEYDLARLHEATEGMPGCGWIEPQGQEGFVIDTDEVDRQVNCATATLTLSGEPCWLFVPFDAADTFPLLLAYNPFRLKYMVI